MKSKFTKGEKILYIAGFCCFLSATLVKIFIGASIGNQQMLNEELRYNIVQEERTVESLTMQVNELISFDNVQNVVKDLGLAYNNNNIIIVD